MPKRFAVILYLLMLSVGFSCKESSAKEDVRKIMGDWYLKPLIFPPKVELVNKQSLEKDEWFKIKPSNKFVVIHYFMADCDLCIGNLKRAQAYIQAHQNSRVSYLFIASAPTKYFVAEAIKKLNFNYPVYFEKEYWSFKNKNGFPVNEKTYDTMLLNDKNQILLFGGVFDNPKAQQYFESYIKEN